jgi:hypothetical protein
MKKHQIISAIGVALLGFAIPYFFITSFSFDVFVCAFSLWMLITIPFVMYLGYICGKYFCKMCCYPLIYGALLIGVLFVDDYYLTNLIGIFGGIAVIAIASMLFWAWFYKAPPKEI